MTDTKTTESFVKEENGVLKIHRFEKHYITLLLEAEIEKVENEHKSLREDTSKPEKYHQMDLAAIEMVERTYLRDLKTVLERVEAMPSTRW